MKFVLFTEGKTEKHSLPQFLQRWLNPQLNQSIGITPVKFSGWAHFQKEAKKKARMYLEGPKASDIIGVIGLLDLYGPTFYPGHTTTADAKYDWAKQHLENEVNHEKFYMFFAVHEVEAWLLGQPEVLPNEIQSALPGKISQPETVNFDEPPAKLLTKVYRQRMKTKYEKVTYGANLFPKLDPEQVAQKCPRFQQMLNKMLELAQSAGN